MISHEVTRLLQVSKDALVPLSEFPRCDKTKYPEGTWEHIACNDILVMHHNRVHYFMLRALDEGAQAVKPTGQADTPAERDYVARQRNRLFKLWQSLTDDLEQIIRYPNQSDDVPAYMYKVLQFLMLCCKISPMRLRIRRIKASVIINCGL